MYQYLYTSYLLITLIVSSTLSSFCMEQELELIPGQAKQHVLLPFQYHHLADQERHNAKLVLERAWTSLEKEGDCAIIGTLCPCECLIIFNQGTSILKPKFNVFHIHGDSNKQSMIEIIRNEYKDYNLCKTQGFIFTSYCEDYDYHRSHGPLGSFEDLYQGRSQSEEIEIIKKTIIDNLGISNPDQIKTYLYKNSAKILNRTQYAYAHLYIFIKYNINGIVMESICPIKESYFGDFGINNIQYRIKETYNAAALKSRNFLSDNFSYELLNGFAFCLYDHIPFKRI